MDYYAWTECLIGGLALWFAWRLRGRVKQTASTAAGWWAGMLGFLGVYLLAGGVEAGWGHRISLAQSEALTRLGGVGLCLAGFCTVQTAARLGFTGGAREVCLWAGRALLVVAVWRLWNSGLVINAMAAQGLALVFLAGVELRTWPQGGGQHGRYLLPGIASLLMVAVLPWWTTGGESLWHLESAGWLLALGLFYRGGWFFRDA